MEESELLKPLNDRVEETIQYLSACVPDAQKRLSSFVEAFNIEFPEEDPLQRGRAEIIPFAVLDVPLALYAAGFFGPSIIEIYSVLEQISLYFLLSFLVDDNKWKIKKALPTMRKLFLTDYAKLLFKLGKLSEDNKIFSVHLRDMRNAIAHKNADKISNYLYSGRDLYLFDVDDVISKELDCIPYLINGIKYLLDLTKDSKD
jgi:hypothetical protein